jgi:UDP-glucose 4-epimerase
LFVEQIKAGKPLTVTDPSMTRFIMTLEGAVDLVLYAYEHARTGDLHVQKAPASTIGDLAQAVKELFHADNEIRTIGIRHGEKMYETLLTNEECVHAIDLDNFYRVPADNRDLNYAQYFDYGNGRRTTLSEFNSNNTQLLSVQQIKETLLTVKYLRHELDSWESR